MATTLVEKREAIGGHIEFIRDHATRAALEIEDLDASERKLQRTKRDDLAEWMEEFRKVVEALWTHDAMERHLVGRSVRTIEQIVEED